MASTPPDHTAGPVDAHFHAWRPGRGDYGWLTPALGALCRDVEVAHWQAMAAPLGIHAGVLVQAAPTEAETTFLLQLADAAPAVLGVVGWVDWLAPDAPQRIARLAARPRLKALRPMLQDIADPDWVLQPALAPALDAMAAHGLAFDALVRPVHLTRLCTLARRHPGLRIVVDHGAKPDIAGGRWQPWADDLKRLADGSGAVCKWSGLLTEAGTLAADLPALARWERQLFEAFGPDRLLWGSDWPVLETAGIATTAATPPARAYADWWHHAQAFTAALPAAQRQAVFGGNARRVYRL